MNCITSKKACSLDIVAGSKVVSIMEAIKGSQIELLFSKEEEKGVKDNKNLVVYYYGGSSASYQYIRNKNEAESLKLFFVPESPGSYRIAEYNKKFANIQNNWANQDI